MSFLLGGTQIKAPQSMTVNRVAQYAQNKALDGTVSRDYFGDDKQIFTLNYRNITPAAYNNIVTCYDSYIASGTRSFDTTGETVVYNTLVHVDLQPRGYTVRGTTYLADFDLILTEA